MSQEKTLEERVAERPTDNALALIAVTISTLEAYSIDTYKNVLGLEKKITAIDKRISALEKRVTTLTKRVTALEQPEA